MRSSRILAPVLCALVALASPAQAGDDPRTACLQSYEKAQELRLDQKLTEARAQLLVCVQPGCSETAQNDCAAWLKEVDRDLPTVVFEVTGPDGKPLLTPTIEVDGKVLLTELDGKAYPVDPGKHTFVFKSAGAERSITEILNVGDKNHKVKATFEMAKPPPPKVAPPSTQPESDDHRGIYAWLSAAALFPMRHPKIFADRFTIEGASSGGFVGVRGGYRVHEFAGIEGMLEYGNIVGPKNGAGARAYSLTSVHIGPLVRIMSPGDLIRFVGTVGGGVAGHFISYEGLGVSSSLVCSGAEECASQGVDFFFVTEAGGELELEGVLIGLSAAFYVSGTKGMNDFTKASTQGETLFSEPYDNELLPLLGPRIYIGYGFW